MLSISKLPSVETLWLIWVDSNNDAGQTNICCNDLEADIFIEAGVVFVAKLVHFKLNVLVGHRVKPVWSLQ